MTAVLVPGPVLHRATKVCRAVVALAALTAPGAAQAHIQLDEPTRREPETSGPGVAQKPSPCGRNFRTANVTVFQPGETITVRWTETINHPGHFRIAFDVDGDDDFQDPVCLTGCDDFVGVTFDLYDRPEILLDGIPDPGGDTFSAQVTLPDVECENCTLQLIQVMYDKPPFTRGLTSNDMYYQCADIALRGDAVASDAGVGDAAPDGAITPDAAPAPDAASPAPDAATSPAPADAGASVGQGGLQTALIEGGCTGVGPGATAPSLLLVPLGLWLMRRRRWPPRP